MKRHAYMILAHNEFHMLKKLINELDDARNDIYIHIDKKARYVDENEISSWAEHSGVFFVPRRKIYWGTLSIVKAEIALLEAAVKRGYHYYHLLSGVDIPLKSQDAIHELLEDQNCEYIKYHSDGEDEDLFLYKLKYYYPLLKYVGKDDHKGPGKKKAFMRWLVMMQWRLLKLQERCRIDRTKNRDMQFFKGDQWFSITHDFAEYIVSRRKKILKMFRLTNGADEFIMPTEAMNSAYSARVRNDSLRMIDWKRGMPYEFTESDEDELCSSDALFARKISYDKHPALVNNLISRLHQQELPSELPLISVVVPCYNIEAYLVQCLDSLVLQTYKNLEILLIDDGSTDRTSDIAKDYAAKHDNIQYYRRENGGLSAARNTGIDLSKGSYIAFVDSDDWVSEDYIEKLYDAIRVTGADVSVCGFVKEELEHDSRTFDNNSLISSHGAMRILGDIYPKENVLLVVAWNKLYRKEIFDNVRYPVGKIHEDEHFAHRYIKESDSVAVITDCLYHYRIRAGSITGPQRAQDLRHLDMLDALEERIEYSQNMMYGDIMNYMLYTYFEGLSLLLAGYNEEVLKGERLYGVFRKKALNIYLKYFNRLDSYQKITYLKQIIFIKKYRNTVYNKLHGNGS